MTSFRATEVTIMEKMYKSVRYYLKKIPLEKSATKKTPPSTLPLRRDLREDMDQHIQQIALGCPK